MLQGLLKRGLVFAVCAASVLGARSAMASITVTDFSQNTSTGEYQYTINVSPNATLDAGDGFVIYDFAQLYTGANIGGGLQSPSFSLFTNGGAQQSNTGNFVLAPAASNGGTANNIDNAVKYGLGYTDNSAIGNVTFDYTGASPLVVGSGGLSGVVTLYTSSTTHTDTLGAAGSKDSTGAGSEQLQESFVTVPTVPEPATLSLLGIGGIMMLARRRRA